VHSLPGAGASNGAGARQTKAGRWKMIAVLLVCAAPVLASYLSYYVIRPDSRRVFGELIDPQRPLPSLQALTPEAVGVELQSLRGQWLLISVGGADCDPLCEQHLYLQRQIRESLGKDKDRVERVWLIDDLAPLRQALLPALHDATVLRVDAAALRGWLAPAAGRALPEHLYLVDPMGNWMMRFPAALDKAGAASAKRDLERLLRASGSWDTPGRQSTGAAAR